MTSRILIPALALASMASAPASAQTVPERTLAAPTARSSDGFTDIVGAVELGDGRLLVGDLRERRLALVDFTRGSIQNVAREGPGPQEFTGVFSVIRGLGDTILVYGQRDLLKLDGTAKPVLRAPLTFSLPAVETGSVRVSGGLSAPRFADAQGRLYFETSDPLTTDASGNFVAALKGGVIRWTPGEDNAVRVAPRDLRDPEQLLVRPWRPYTATDASAALRDGSVMVIRAKNYRAEIWRDNKLVLTGAPVAHTPIPIGAAERDAFRDARSRQQAGGVRMSGPPGAAAAERPAEREAARRSVGIPDNAFPPMLPPIVDTRATLVDLSNRVWVARSFAANDPTRRYDVFNERAELVERVVVPRRGRVIGFGRGVVYVVTPDDDDIQWIERYVLR